MNKQLSKETLILSLSLMAIGIFMIGLGIGGILGLYVSGVL